MRERLKGYVIDRQWMRKREREKGDCLNKRQREIDREIQTAVEGTEKEKKKNA